MSFTAFSLGFIDVYWYGISVSLAIVCALIIAVLAARFDGESCLPIVDMTLWGIPSALVGARLVYVLMFWHDFAAASGRIFAVWEGGLSVYGAAAGFLISAVIYLKRHGLPVWHWLDILSPGMALILMLLQLTNFIMQFSVGLPLPVDMPNDHSLAEYIEFHYRPSGFEDYLYFKPVALYQAAAQCAVFIIVSLLFLLRKHWQKLYADGTLFLLMMLALSAVRFVFGFMYLSMDNDVWASWVQWLSLLGMGCVIIVYIGKRVISANRK